MWAVLAMMWVVSLSELAVLASGWLEQGIGTDDMTFWTRHLAVQLALDGVRCADFGTRCQRAEAGSVRLGTDAFLSCRVESPSARVARVNTALDKLCFTHSSCSSAHNSHERMPVARCVVNSVGDTEDGGRRFCQPVKVA